MINKYRCCENPEGNIIPVGKDGYICKKCSDDLHKRVLKALKQKSEGEE